MKKLYLILLMLLILFIPTQVNAVAIYQLDQPIRELNGHTLREVFEGGALISEVDSVFDSYLNWNTHDGAQLTQNVAVLRDNDYSAISHSLNQSGDNYNDYYYLRYEVKTNTLGIKTLRTGNYSLNEILLNSLLDSSVGVHTSIIQGKQSGSMNIIYFYITPYTTGIIILDNIYIYNISNFGILPTTNMDKYYNLYLEAVRFENENIEASQDVGGYQNIFRSILNGVKGLMTEMAGVWDFLNAPIITSDMQDYSINIDWSWDLIGVLRQLIGSLAVLILQVNFLFINLLFSFTGIPIQISILSMIFSNFIFVVLGWIIVKSFII